MRLDHALILTTDLAAMTEFLTNAIGLEQGSRPAFSFQGAWFYSENLPLIHVAQSSNFINDGGPIDHVALKGANYQKLIKRLNKQGVQFEVQRVPGPGERQVFVSGPDGLRVEMLFPLADKNDEPKSSPTTIDKPPMNQGA